MKMEITDPNRIEERSFEIIGEELGMEVSDEIKPTLFRIIHTTADFEYAALTKFSKDSIKRAKDAMRSGCRMYADTNMIKSGIRKTLLEKFNCDVYTYISDTDVAKEAKERGITRSIVGIEKACQDKDTKIFLIGNAPTALFTLKEQIEKGNVSPELVVAVPVGFVGAAESKEAILEVDVPHIVAKGRKGGSPIAVSIVNSILLQLDKE